MSDDLKDYIAARVKVVDAALRRHLPRTTAKPPTIHRAMRYSIFAGGKRLRPVLSLAAAASCGGKEEAALAGACAIECVHTYSLIHDDLPCMDNDDFRRGKPTNHKVFGDGIAVLAGDALLTVAFEILTRIPPSRRYGIGDYVAELAVTAGSLKLIAGQVMDIEGEGAKSAKKPTLAQVRFIHESKTAALLTTALRFGGMSANATPRQLAALTTFGHAVGLAFQVIDDILDVTQSSQKLGKSAGKDQAADKATYPAVMGLARSRKEATRLTHEALDSLKVFGKRGARLEQLAHYLLDRDY